MYIPKPAHPRKNADQLSRPGHDGPVETVDLHSCAGVRVREYGNVRVWEYSHIPKPKDTDRDTSQTPGADREIHARMHTLGHTGLARYRVRGGQDTKLKLI